MKKLFLLLLGIPLLVGIFFAWKVMGPSTSFKESYKYFYIPSNQPTKELVLEQLEKDSITNTSIFSRLADRFHYWKNIRPGKYRIEKGSSALTIFRKLRNGKQEPVNFVIVKFRTREALAGALGKKLECDSLSILQFMNNKDSMNKFGLDTSTAMTIVFPNTYTTNWNITPGRVFNKFYEEYRKVWNPLRRQQALQQKLTPTKAYILASIIDEETNDKEDKPKMASVYLNRLEMNMPLGADPTVKFALRNFELKRIYEKHTAVVSPYNTYKVTGLPPGPICTPSLESLDAVLQAPKTDYLFFVANSDFSGNHIFTSSYSEHLKYAKLYQDALNQISNQQGTSTPAK